MSINTQEIRTIITHAGVFHADDVFTTAWLRLIGVTAHVHRVSKLPLDLDGALVFDIGLGKYDHHQAPDSKAVRSNGIPYAAFGLVFRDTYEYVFTEDEANGFDKSFIQPLDANDNGYVADGEVRRPYPLATMISAFNPNWDEAVDVDDQFHLAVEMAKTILSREIRRVKATTAAKVIADKVIAEGKRVAFLDRFAPISFQLRNSVTEWIGYPSLRGGYSLLSIMDAEKRNKALFPEEFRGKPASELPSGMTFCHPGGFIAEFEDLAAAKAFADTYL